jgi:hypothetical protein
MWKYQSYLEELIAGGLDHLILEFDPEKDVPVTELDTIFSQDLFTCVRFPRSLTIKNFLNGQSR